ncbi:MAG TPA: hypothetical protein VNV82_19690 [Bryobacteraceae bacterium]|jgi:hypothetical protein|nr:hypothetical protein [Bryobacteraceae bacterium]
MSTSVLPPPPSGYSLDQSTAFTPPPLSSHAGPAPFTPPPLSSHTGPATEEPHSWSDKLDDLSQGAGDAAVHMTLGAYEMFRKAAKAIGFDKLPEPSDALKQAGQTPDNASAWRRWGRRIEEIGPYVAFGGSPVGSALVAGSQTEGDPGAMLAAGATSAALKAGPAVAKAVWNAPPVSEAAKNLIGVVSPRAKNAISMLDAIRAGLRGAPSAAEVAPASRIIAPDDIAGAARPDWRQAIVDEANPSATASAPPPPGQTATPTTSTPGASLQRETAAPTSQTQSEAIAAPKRDVKAQALAYYLHQGEGLTVENAMKLAPPARAAMLKKAANAARAGGFDDVPDAWFDGKLSPRTWDATMAELKKLKAATPEPAPNPSSDSMEDILKASIEQANKRKGLQLVK